MYLFLQYKLCRLQYNQLECLLCSKSYKRIRFNFVTKNDKYLQRIFLFSIKKKRIKRRKHLKQRKVKNKDQKYFDLYFSKLYQGLIWPKNIKSAATKSRFQVNFFVTSFVRIKGPNTQLDSLITILETETGSDASLKSYLENFKKNLRFSLKNRLISRL